MHTNVLAGKIQDNTSLVKPRRRSKVYNKIDVHGSTVHQ